ncbi:uncharacterized protein LOC132598581 isoform X3 [Lycium barbarum]|uniref:uncharacterized protein LOC132598581 isoform X3 n=1 Tax=Lycium barbarum TaxID=112863 RepID=UPI00293F3DFE|nr:uncharacterized protein LOC132598581 isoform X3 [Lycium barbarum]
MKRISLFRNYIWQWCIMFLLSAIHCGLLYSLYVPDWKFSVSQSTWSTIYELKCSVRGDLGPACNSAGMVDRYILGINHLYAKPVYRNMKECNGSNMPSWCHAAFDPEGILRMWEHQELLEENTLRESVNLFARDVEGVYILAMYLY